MNATSWKTTVAGLLAACAALQTELARGADIAAPKTWVLPVLIAILGYFAQDHTPAAPRPS